MSGYRVHDVKQLYKTVRPSTTLLWDVSSVLTLRRRFSPFER